MANMIDLNKLSKEQLAALASSAFGGGEEVKKNAKKGPEYGGLGLDEIMAQFQQSGGAENLLEQYGRNPNIRWGY